MTPITYPGPLMRPVPTFSMDIPVDWVVTEFPNALFLISTLLEPDAGGPWSNVIVRHERVLPSVSLESYSAWTWQSLVADFPDAVIKESVHIQFACLHLLRDAEVHWPTDKDLAARIDSFVFGPDTEHPTRDLFQFTWLNPSAAGDERKLIYVDMLRSIRFDAKGVESGD